MRRGGGGRAGGAARCPCTWHSTAWAPRLLLLLTCFCLGTQGGGGATAASGAGSGGGSDVLQMLALSLDAFMTYKMQVHVV